MSRSNPNEDEELLIPHGEDQTSTEPWQPISSPYREASGYERGSVPANSDGDRKLNQAGEYRDDYTDDYRDDYRDEARQYHDVEEPPSYYNQQGQKRGPSDDDDEMLVPAAEDNRRPRWDMAGNPYQTQRFYDDPRHNVSPGYPQYTQYPQYPQQSSANASTNSNNIVLVQPGASQSRVVVTEHISDYTALSVFTLLCCCLPLGICALIKARDAQTSLQLGRREQALEQSNTSRNLNIAGIIIGPILTTVIILLNFFVLSQRAQ